MESTVINCDCVEYMKTLPDKFFSLAICDPPYGIGADLKNSKREFKSKKSATISNYFGNQIWDNSTPNSKYFEELKRISERQIIWGANYFGFVGGMLYWHKNVTMPTYSTGELAWLSWLQKIDFVNITWHGMIQQDMQNKEHRIHPTQKPVELYKWLLKNYAKEGDTIFDSHGGSMSSVIACLEMGYQITCCELDKDYFNSAKQRIENYLKQLDLFKEQPKITFKEIF